MPEVQMPRLSDTMTEGVLSRWLKAEGDIVHKGDVLAEIETDKATMDLEAYDEGPLTALLVAEGTTVPIGQPIAVIGASTGGTSTPEASQSAASPAPQASEAPAHRAAPESGSPAGRYRATPLVRKIARDHGIDLGTVTGTGPHQRIIRADIEPIVAALGKSTGAPIAKPGPTTAPSTSPAAAPVATAGDETIPLTRIRRVTAQRLTESAAVPHFYLTGVVDAERLLALRADINAALTGSDERVSVTDLLVRACAVALRAHPLLNSSWAGDSILRHGGIHIGVAVATEAGLVVPVVRDADRKGVREIATDARSLAERAHAGTLSLQELSGGTFTISNLGMYGVDHFTAIINPPEAAILAVGAATPTPVARDGEVVVRSVMKMTLSVDHRVVDGAPAAAFLRELIDVVEAPLRIVV
jgi:pyruvate dehydrogenase E2 component (dihydrolipoamide acetyltransferase)